MGLVGGDRLVDSLQGFLGPVQRQQILDERPQRTQVDDLIQVELALEDTVGRRLVASRSAQQTRELDPRYRPVARAGPQPFQELQANFVIALGSGRSRRDDVSLGARVGAFANLSLGELLGSGPIPEREVDLGEIEGGVRTALIHANGLAILGHRTLGLPHLLCGLTRQETRAGVVRPQPQARLEDLERACRIVASQADASRHEIAVGGLFQARGDLGRALEIALEHEEVCQGKAQRFRLTRRAVERVLERLAGLRGVARLAVEGRQRLPGRDGVEELDSLAQHLLGFVLLCLLEVEVGE